MCLNEKIRQNLLWNEAKNKREAQTKATDDRILISEEAAF
jgi:hypothetical protein